MQQSVWVVIILILCNLNLNAQDTLILNDGSEIYGKVLEIDNNTLSYKKQGNITGPTYSVNLSKIYMAFYQGGKREIFTSVASSNNNQKSSETPKIQQNISKNNSPVSQTNTQGYALREGSIEVKLKNINTSASSSPNKKNGSLDVINVSGYADIYNNNKLFTTVSYSIIHYKSLPNSYNEAFIKNDYFSKSNITIKSDQHKKYFFQKFENETGEGSGNWTLPPNFFSLDPNACSVGFMATLLNGGRQKQVVKYPLLSCSNIEYKILSIILLWTNINFGKGT